jgi:hypothetical protein
MELRLQIPFQELLTMIKTLDTNQKAKLRRELDADLSFAKEKNEFMEMLLNGPVYSEDDIKLIEENRNSIEAWRTKD